MGFGPTSSSILLLSGLTPMAVSASVNLAKVATGVVAALSHWRFYNLDRGLVIKLALPGSVGALAGVTVLASIDGATLRPYLAMLLMVIGVRILIRFARPVEAQKHHLSPPDARGKRTLIYDKRGVSAAALVGGITNGMIGAWGPVITPFLLHRGVRPNYAIGCVNTAEVMVAATASLSLIASLGRGGFNRAVVVAMLVGGIIAAPVAAWFIRKVPPRPVGLAVAALLMLTNARDLAAWVGLSSSPWMWAVYLGILAIVLIASVVWRSPDDVSSPSALPS
jgi:uncharacterized membrane protein YfcA